MKKTFIISVLSFFSLIIIQITLSFTLGYVLFEILNIKEKESLKFVVQLSIDISLIIVIFSLIYYLKIQFKDSFKIPTDKSILVTILLAILIVLISPLIDLITFFKTLRDNYIAFCLPNTNKVLTIDYFLLRIIIIGPILEEIYFRGIIQKILSKKIKPFVAILISSLLFSLGHLDFNQFLSFFLIGLIIGTLYYKTNNLLLVIILHVVANLLITFTKDKYIYLEGINNMFIFVYPIVLTLIYLILKKTFLLRNSFLFPFLFK